MPESCAPAAGDVSAIDGACASITFRPAVALRVAYIPVANTLKSLEAAGASAAAARVTVVLAPERICVEAKLAVTPWGKPAMERSTDCGAPDTVRAVTV